MNRLKKNIKYIIELKLSNTSMDKMSGMNIYRIIKSITTAVKQSSTDAQSLSSLQMFSYNLKKNTNIKIHNYCKQFDLKILKQNSSLSK